MITKAELKRFRAIGHGLRPIVTIAGKGLNAEVLKELDRALNDHELIKIRIHGQDRQDRKNTLLKITALSGTEIIQKIGNVAVLYKAAIKSNPKLSNILRSDILSHGTK